MADRITPEQRSANMSRIRSKGTRPEMSVRRLLHKMGLRYRLHAKDLPGKPDVVFRKRKAVILVNGCYWHGHGCKRGGAGAKSNSEYWTPKIAGNVARDARNLGALAAAGWRVLVVWECETTDLEALEGRLEDFMLDRSRGSRPPCKSG